MASSSTQPGAASKKSILEPVMILEGHEKSTRKPPERTYHNICSISYFSDGEQMVSGSEDQTVRRWDLQAGKEIEGVREVCEEGVHAVGVSRDGRWIVTAGGDDNECGELKIWEVRTGITRTFEGHSQSITCIDISADSTLLASGVRCGRCGTIRVWNLKTGKLLFETPTRWVGVVRFSQDSKKLAVISDVARCLEVWDVETHRLDTRLLWKFDWGMTTRAPVIWTAKDHTILAAFNFKDDDDIDEPKTIYEFDASTLQTRFRDQTIKLWAFESRQLLASFDVHAPDHLIFSPNSHQLAYTTRFDTKIYICDTPPHILATIQSAQEAQPNINAATNPRLPS
ncbi:quinon protein alcohol dehydrogenase-like superfamily [Suillus plorans]|uniref:Quinon protein alcohol dehydrogenase-like superfamily n=1 Tax=Suillus plorans TaxID=116603 RepID=A0A9P7J755_9AGAM|nr:quinon protein alcohol dehydrogenase-like superfamily [Suillus plorans]KAG1806553.1 quinon protein alcohol dehydrogenase-like superfamily [Suillus plorans]